MRRLGSITAAMLLAAGAAGAIESPSAAAPTSAPAGVTGAAGAAAPTGALRVAPARVPIGILFNGVTLEVRAEVPAGYQAAVRLMGREEHLELKRKGRAAGVLWMSVGEVAFDHVPVAYQLLTSAPLAELASPATLAQERLGYAAVVHGDGEAAALGGDLIKLKEQGALFALGEGRLGRGPMPPAPGRVVATAGGLHDPPTAPVVMTGSFRLPARTPPGDYRVDLFSFKDGRVAHLGSATVRLAHAGAARALKRLAMEHGLLYGCAAVLIAVVVGLLTGLIFQPRSGEAH